MTDKLGALNRGTTYRAVVKYPVDATDKEKLSALREGLQEIVVEMIEEQGVTLEYVENALEDAQSAAESSLVYREQWEREHPEARS